MLFMNLVFCKRIGNKDDGKKMKKKAKHTYTSANSQEKRKLNHSRLSHSTHTKLKSKRKTIFFCTFSMRYEPKRTGMIFAEVRLAYSRTHPSICTYIYINVYNIYSNSNNVKRKRIFFHPISIQYAALFDAQFFVSRYTMDFLLNVTYFFFVLLWTSVAEASAVAAPAAASSCVDLTVKLINNKQCFRSTIFLPPALFWVRLILGVRVILCIYACILHFPVYRHYNLELFMPESTFELLRSGFHFENPNVNYFSVMVSDGIVCLSLCQPQISYFQFKQIQNNSKIVLSSNILLTTEMKKNNLNLNADKMLWLQHEFDREFNFWCKLNAS